MLDPNEIIKLSEQSEIVAAELQEEIVKDICERIALRLGRGDDYILTARDKWQLEVLKDAGYLVDDLIKIIAKKTGVTVKEMRKAFAEAGVSSTKFDDLTYERAGLPVIPIQQSPAMIRLLERGMNKTFSEWKNYTGTTVRAAYDLYVKECDRAYNNVLSGHMTYGEAVKVALNHASADGGEVIYPSGHRDTLETATYRAVRTGISQACSDVTSVRAAENGITLFITSSHLGARPTHEPWQGKVFWVDWDLLSTALGITYENPNTASISEKAKYDEFVKTTEIGTVTGLCGANCRHSYGPYIEGISHNPYTQFDSEENRKRYEAEQTQRSFERKIRKQRRKVEGLKAGLKEMDPSVAKETRDQLKREQAKLNDLQRQYKEYSEDQGLKVQTNRLETVRAMGPVERFKLQHPYNKNGFASNYKEAINAVKDIPDGYSKNPAQAYNLMRFNANENAPVLVDNLNELDGPVIYRGVEPSKELSAERIIENTKYGVYPWIGKGNIAGSGLYFTSSKETAEKLYGDTVIEGKLLSGNFIDLQDLRRMAFNELGPANMPKARDLSIYALEKGYDVIWVKTKTNGIMQYYFNILNRKVLALQK